MSLRTKFPSDALPLVLNLPTIDIHHVIALNPFGCIQVIDLAWDKCTKLARIALLNHKDKPVRELAHFRHADIDVNKDNVFLTAEKVCYLMRKYEVAIHELANRLSVPVCRVRSVREHGICGRERCNEWLEAIRGKNSSKI